MPSAIVKKLADKGVRFPNPESVMVAEDVDPDRISGKGVVIHPGCRISGRDTFIHSGALLGEEGPVTIENCFIGPKVQLKGGFMQKAVFLEGAGMGFGAHVREGTIFEEGASAAHTVGLKQTILFPFVTLGSLINFCDCFMAGGTSRKDHSEVGSSYIHFNYTPNQDKATPSLIGDVARGVMMNQRPIFLGGQGGLVGPCRIEYGTIIAAGSIYRKDQLKPGRLVFDGNSKGGSVPFEPGLYRNVGRIVKNNTLYLANLMALRQWYLQVRPLFFSEDFPEALWKGLCDTLNLAIEERLKRLDTFFEKMPESLRICRKAFKGNGSEKLIQQKEALYDNRERIEIVFRKHLGQGCDQKAAAGFLEKIHTDIARHGKDYIPVIKGLDSTKAESGNQWLLGIVDCIVAEIADLIPSIY